MSSTKKFIDVASHLLNDKYRGVYHGLNVHEPDMPHVLQRAANAGIEKLIITAHDFNECEASLKIAQGKYNDLELKLNKLKLYSTVGVHPSKCSDHVIRIGHIEMMTELAKNNPEKIVAIGECGLDYELESVCNKDIQKRCFEMQLEAGRSLNLPILSLYKKSFSDFIGIVQKFGHNLRGVAQSFDGTKSELHALIDSGFHIGISGCSLKTIQNLEIVRNIPADKIVIGTNSPLCEIIPAFAGFRYIKTHFGKMFKEKWSSACMIKTRNEPATLINIIEILSTIRNENPYMLAEQIYENSEELFFNS